MIEDLSNYIEYNKSGSNVILAGDMNEAIDSKNIDKFLISNGLFNIHEQINGADTQQREATYEFGSKYINLLAVIGRLLEFINGSKMIDFKEYITTDHQGYIVDINLIAYFEEEFSNWDQINKLLLGPGKRSY